MESFEKLKADVASGSIALEDLAWSSGKTRRAEAISNKKLLSSFKIRTRTKISYVIRLPLSLLHCVHLYLVPR